MAVPEVAWKALQNYTKPCSQNNNDIVLLIGGLGGLLLGGGGGRRGNEVFGFTYLS